MAEENEQAWIEFDAKYRGMSYAIGKNRGLTQTDCEDLVQEVMLVCCQRIGHSFYDRSKGRFRSWLTTVTRNIIWQQQRKNRQPQADALPAYDDEINLSFMKQYEQFLLDSCLKLLRERVTTETYSAFDMLCLQQLPTEEVSRITRESPAALYLMRMFPQSHILIFRHRQPAEITLIPQKNIGTAAEFRFCSSPFQFRPNVRKVVTG